MEWFQEPPKDTKTQGCASSLHKMAWKDEYNHAFVSEGFAFTDSTKHRTEFWLVAATDEKSMDSEG